jgi:multidrug efflux system outer membrane protein
MKRLAMILAGSALTACSMVPPYQQPPAPVAATWPTGPAYAAIGAAVPVGRQALFSDARLNRLIDGALANNRELRTAFANVRAARESWRIQQADRFPALTASAGATLAGDRNSSADSYSARALVPAFEIDLFGRVAALTEAERQAWLSTDAGARAVRLALVGQVADAWLAYAADASLLALAEDTAANARRTVQLTRARLQGGVAPRTDLRQAEQILAAAEADVARQTSALAQDRNALDLLAGAPVDPALLPDRIETAAASIGDVPAGVDSAVLLRRPDVLAAEHSLRAANARIGAARAAMFPSISLTGAIGFASNALSSLFSGGAFAWSGNAAAGATIFNGGALRAGVRQREAQRDAALADYEGAIQSAFRDVADGLARAGTYGAEEAAVRMQVSASEDSFRLADARYRGGIDSFLARLDAQRSYYAAQKALVSTLLGRATNRVALYRALGGDEALAPAEAVP